MGSIASRVDSFFRTVGGHPTVFTVGLGLLSFLVFADLFLSRVVIDAGIAIEGNPIAQPLVMNLPLGVAVKTATLLGFALVSRRVPARVVGLMLTLLLGIYSAVVVNNVAIL